jgi:hypothetical protein
MGSADSMITADCGAVTHDPVASLTPEIHTQLTRGPRRIPMSAADAGARKDHPQSRRTLR